MLHATTRLVYSSQGQLHWWPVRLRSLLQLLLLLEQAIYGCTSFGSQARYAVYNLADTGDSKNSSFAMQHLGNSPGYTIRYRNGGF